MKKQLEKSDPPSVRSLKSKVRMQRKRKLITKFKQKTKGQDKQEADFRTRLLTNGRAFGSWVCIVQCVEPDRVGQ